MAPRTLRLLREFLLPESVEQRNIAALDAGLSPNDALDTMDHIVADPDVDDVAVIEEAVLVSAGRTVWRLDGSGAPWQYAELPAPASGLAADPQGGVLVCLAGQGLARIGADGTVSMVAAEADGSPLACLTAVTVTQDGRIFVTEGSTCNGVDEWARDLLEKRRTGRLIEVDRRTGATRVVWDGLGWPHGVCQATGGASLVLTESWRHRLLRVDPDGAELHVLRGELPGYPARIAPAAGSGYWLGFLSLRSHLLELVLREDAFRADMMARIDPEYWIRPALRATTAPWEPLQIGQMKHLGLTKPWAPPRSYGLIARIADDGAPTASYHSRAGGMRHGTLTAREYGGRLYVVSRGGKVLLTTTVEG